MKSLYVIVVVAGLPYLCILSQCVSLSFLERNFEYFYHEWIWYNHKNNISFVFVFFSSSKWKQFLLILLLIWNERIMHKNWGQFFCVRIRTRYCIFRFFFFFEGQFRQIYGMNFKLSFLIAFYFSTNTKHWLQVHDLYTICCYEVTNCIFNQTIAVVFLCVCVSDFAEY